MSSVFYVWFCVFLCFVLLFFLIASYILLLIMFSYSNIVYVRLSLQIKRLLTYLLHFKTMPVKATEGGVLPVPEHRAWKWSRCNFFVSIRHDIVLLDENVDST